jgi:hypothetical protein
MGGKLLVENQKIIWAIEPKNWTGAASTGDWVSLKLYAHLTIVIQSGAWAAGTSAITLEQATAVAGTGNKALAFTKQWNDVTTGGTLVETAVTSNTFTIGTANKVWVIEVDADTLDVAGGFDAVTVKGATPGVNADFYGAMYYLSKPRYAQATPPSAIID